MGIVGAFDLHRRQITYRWHDTDTGEVRRGKIAPAAREPLRAWLAELPAPGHFALEGTTGWRFVVEELEAAGCTPHLADPAEVAIRRGPKRRAKTDHADCEHMTKLLLEGRLPEAWIPPPHIVEVRTLSRLRKSLVDDRRQWTQRIQAQLFHQGVPPGLKIRTAEGRARLAEAELSPAGRRVIEVGLRVLEDLDRQIGPLDRDLAAFARRQRGCRALQSLYGVGLVTSVAILTELGDARRLSRSDAAVRYAGLDVTVYSSDGHRSPGHLSRQGPGVLRWALYEAAQCAARPTSPDHAYYLEARERLGHNRACLSVARKLCRRAYHLLRDFGEEALDPTEAPSSQAVSEEAA